MEETHFSSSLLTQRPACTTVRSDRLTSGDGILDYHYGHANLSAMIQTKKEESLGCTPSTGVGG
jgi:hypothetical protein